MGTVRKKDKTFEKVKSIVESLYKDGLTSRGRGYCIAMSDIIQKLLMYNGIDSYLQECSLMIVKSPTSTYDDGSTDMMIIGYPLKNDTIKSEELQTHVVCITKTDIPILIDLSIENFVHGVPYICHELVGESTEFSFPRGKFFYTLISENTKLPFIHERSIVKRIQTDKKIFNYIFTINKILIVLSIVTVLNFIRGLYDFNQKYFIKDNNFGPNKTLVK